MTFSPLSPKRPVPILRQPGPFSKPETDEWCVFLPESMQSGEKTVMKFEV
jgi:hypothetical protein